MSETWVKWPAEEIATDFTYETFTTDLTNRTEPPTCDHEGLEDTY